MGTREWWYLTNTRRVKMDAKTRERKQSALKTLLRQMDIPAMRSDVTNAANLRWLSRNLAANNGDRPMFDTAFAMVLQLLRG